MSGECSHVEVEVLIPMRIELKRTELRGYGGRECEIVYTTDLMYSADASNETQ
jgi:hypothetical protein